MKFKSRSAILGMASNIGNAWNALKVKLCTSCKWLHMKLKLMKKRGSQIFVQTKLEGILLLCSQAHYLLVILWRCNNSLIYSPISQCLPRIWPCWEFWGQKSQFNSAKAFAFNRVLSKEVWLTDSEARLRSTTLQKLSAENIASPI